MSGIDPLRLAQFMVLPGASELVDAFSAIPPGPLRDSIVHHARMLAEASGWRPPTPASMHPQTARVVGIYPPPAPMLESPHAEGLSSVSPEGQIVERALRGEPDHLIAASLGVKLGLVVRVKRKARLEGGVVFPGEDAEKPVKPPKAAKGTKRHPVFERFPVPNPPYWWEDPASPIWDNPAILPSFSENPKGSMAGLGPLDRRTYTTMVNSAKRKGMTLRGLIAQRYEIIRRIDAGEMPTAISLAMRITPYDVYGLLDRIGRSRMAELNARPLPQEAPASAAAPTLPEKPESPPTGAPEPRQGHADPDAPVPIRGGAAAAKQAAATRWGFTTVTRFEDVRRQVRDLRLAGNHAMAISRELGMSQDFVKAAISYWRKEHGVTFPAAAFRVGKVRAVA